MEEMTLLHRALDDLMAILMQTRGTSLLTLGLGFGDQKVLFFSPRLTDSFLFLFTTGLLGYMMACDPFSRTTREGLS